MLLLVTSIICIIFVVILSMVPRLSVLDLPDFYILRKQKSYGDHEAYKVILYMYLILISKVFLNFYALVNVYNVDFKRYLIYILNGHGMYMKLEEASTFVKGKFIVDYETTCSSLTSQDMREISEKSVNGDVLIQNCSIIDSKDDQEI